MNLFEMRLRRYRRQCQERQRYLGEISQLGERLRADAATLLVALTQPGAAAPWPLVERHRRLLGSIAEVERRIADAGRALAAAQEELHRHELALQRAGDRRTAAAASHGAGRA